MGDRDNGFDLTRIAGILSTGLPVQLTATTVGGDEALDVNIVAGGTSVVITETTDTQDLTVGPMDFLTSPAADFKFGYVLISFDVALGSNETLTISIEPAAGAAFNTIIETVELPNDTEDFFYQPDSDLVVLSGGDVRIQITDGNGPAATASALFSREAM